MRPGRWQAERKGRGTKQQRAQCVSRNWVGTNKDIHCPACAPTIAHPTTPLATSVPPVTVHHTRGPGDHEARGAGRNRRNRVGAGAAAALGGLERARRLWTGFSPHWTGLMTYGSGLLDKAILHEGAELQGCKPLHICPCGSLLLLLPDAQTKPASRLLINPPCVLPARQYASRGLVHPCLCPPTPLRGCRRCLCRRLLPLL